MFKADKSFEFLILAAHECLNLAFVELPRFSSIRTRMYKGVTNFSYANKIMPVSVYV